MKYFQWLPNEAEDQPFRYIADVAGQNFLSEEKVLWQSFCQIVWQISRIEQKRIRHKIAYQGGNINELLPRLQFEEKITRYVEKLCPEVAKKFLGDPRKGIKQ